MAVKRKFHVTSYVIRFFMWIYAGLVIFPLVWVFFTSLKTNKAFTEDPWKLFGSPQFINYVNAWNKASFGKYAMNSIVITLAMVLVSTLIACCAAYVLVRIRFRGANHILTFFISGLYIPVVLILPTEFVMLNSMDLINNRAVLVLVYTALSLPYSILVMSGFLRAIPREMEEAAYIDGCGLNRTFWEIAMPLAKNGIFTMAIFNLLWVWNDFVVTLTLIITEAKRTLPVGTISLAATFKFRADWVTLFAGLNMIMIPTVIVYIIFQKSLQQGLTLGAVKG